jgi:hypothetical protein
MEDVLCVYQRPYDAARPVVCLDESRKELHAELVGREPIPLNCGHPQRVDYGYKRQGSANLFMVSEPLRGWRRVAITTQHTKLDVADQLKQIVDEDYPQVEKVVLVTDNLTSHTMAALYERFPPHEARRIAERLEWHYTPEHGSWLNMAEIEFAALQRQCLNRRIPDKQTLQREVTAWAQVRNTVAATIEWHFTADDARTKLRSLYPNLLGNI